MRILMLIAAAAPLMVAAQENRAQGYFTDVVLVNQDGQKLRFYTDLLKGKTVVVNSFFAECTSVCPPMMAKLSKLQDALGKRFGRDVIFLSITADPVEDTPPRLKAYAEKFRARPGWHLLTGKKENVDWALYKIGQYVQQRDDHSTLLVVGNEPAELWSKVPSTQPSKAIVAAIEEILARK